MKNHSLFVKSGLALAIASAFIASSVSAALVGMTWTPGGNTTTISDGPLTADMGTIDSSGTTSSSMSARLTTNPNDQEVGALWFDGSPTAGAVSSQTIRLAYDVTVNTQPASATGQPKNLDQVLNGGSAAAGTAGILLGMNIAATVPGPASPWAFRFALAPTSATGGVFAMRSPDNTTLMAFANYTVGTKYSVELDANYSTGLMDAYINGALALSDYQFASGGAGVSTSEVFIHLNGENDYANSVAIDNLNMTAPVPEPTTMIAGALLLLPFGASTVRILRRNRTA